MEEERLQMANALKEAEERNETLRRRVDDMNRDHKRMRAALVKEVGEGADLESILNDLPSASACQSVKRDGGVARSRLCSSRAS